MKNLYDLREALTEVIGKCLSPVLKSPKNNTLKTIKGKKTALETISRDFKIRPSKPTVWVSATSFGDFNIARPLVDKLQDQCNIIITFNKSEAYEAYTQPVAKYDNIFYLPVDSVTNAKSFIDCVKPSAAVFVESDLPTNYLATLKATGIPAFLISAKAGDDLLKGKLGSIFHKNFSSFEKIFTAEDVTAEKLRKMGLSNVETSGDPLFDNAMAVAMEPYTNDVVERFKGNKPLFIAGSIHMDDDLDMIERLAGEFTDVRFLIVPQDVSSKKITEIKKRLGLNIPSYTEIIYGAPLPPANSLIVNYKGDLAKLYRYADFVYVGGGFGKSLHSLIEPIVYGLPISFGPNIKNSPIAQIMDERGVGERFSTYPQLRMWISSFLTDSGRKDEVKRKAQKLFEEHTGATDIIVKDILKAAKGSQTAK